MAGLKVALCGLGRWGRNHLRALNELGAEVYVVDPRLTPEEAFAAGVEPGRFAARLPDVLDRVDAVDIVTPADTHYDLAKTAIEAGRHVMVEKPPCLRLRELDDLAERAERARRVLQFGFVFRYHPVTRRLRERAKEIGRVRYFHGRFCGFKPARTDVGVTYTDGIHFIDLAVDWLGGAPRDVGATLTDFFGRGMDDMSHVTMRWDDAVAYVESGHWYPATVQEFTVVGDEGALRGLFREGRVERWKTRPADAGRAETPEAEAVTGDEPLKAQLGAFVECVRSGAPATVGATQIRATMETALRAYDGSKVEPCRVSPRTQRWLVTT